MTKRKNGKVSPRKITKRNLEGMVEILKSLEENGHFSDKEIIKMINAAGYQVKSGGNHLIIYSPDARPVETQYGKAVVISKGRRGRDSSHSVLLNISRHIREEYSELIAQRNSY